MECFWTIKRCAACNGEFRPRPQVPNQTYCPLHECQRKRHSRWEQTKRQTDPDYRDNQARAQQAWLERNPDYYRKYRDDHPESTERNKRVFEDIVGNIKAIGIKKPITVTPRPGEDGAERYLLVCGEGRLNAFRSLGEATIPALVIDVNDEDAFIMSLAENIARRQCRPLEILAGIKQLLDKGYSPKDIATKTGLTNQYVIGILTLLQQ